MYWLSIFGKQALSHTFFCFSLLSNTPNRLIAILDLSLHRICYGPVHIQALHEQNSLGYSMEGVEGVIFGMFVVLRNNLDRSGIKHMNRAKSSLQTATWQAWRKLDWNCKNKSNMMGI